MEYYQFTDMFDKQCSRLLPKYYSYNLAIYTKEGLVPCLGPIYFLLTLELQTLQKFIDKNI